MRCVAIEVTLTELIFDHQPRSMFGAADRVRVFKPLMRMPVLVSDRGTVLTDIL